MAKQPADNPMIGIVMKSLGIDPVSLLGQAKQIGDVIEQLRMQQTAALAGQAEILALLAHQSEMLSTLQIALGVAPPPTEAQLALIATESNRFANPQITAEGFVKVSPVSEQATEQAA